MKNSKNFQRIMTVLGLVLLLAVIIVDKFYEEELAVMLFLAALWAVWLAIYFMRYIVTNVYKVVKYRKSSWAQEHKFLWALLSVGIVQIPLIAWPVLFTHGLNVWTIILLIISASIHGTSHAKIEAVEREYKVEIGESN